MTVFTLILTGAAEASVENTFLGSAGFFWARPDLVVISGELGQRLCFGDAGLEVRFAYWDVARGDLNGQGHEIYPSRAYLELSPGPFCFRVGRQGLTYGDGLWLSDLDMGADGARLGLELTNLRADLLWFLRSDSLRPGFRPDRNLAGLYLSIGPNWLLLDIYGGAETQALPDRWLGARLYLNRTGFRLKGELASNRKGSTWVAEGVFWGLGVAELGGGFFHFSEAWRSPFSYPYIMDGYYNGWTGFGDALSWDAMTDTLLAPYVSSGTGGIYGIYWMDMHSFEAADLSVLFGMTEELSGRLDALVYLYLPGREEIGREASLNLFYDTEGFRFGLGGGYMIPGDFLRGLGRDDPYWTVRLWAFRGFELGI
ncbi:MAG: hypothetical protein ACP5QG_09540 [candidate division WOR-3 bacterium]